MVSIAGSGSGTVTGTGISCPGDCSQDYPIGSEVTLTATPTSGTFTTWSGGGCSGTAPCEVTMGTNTVVSATFTADPAPPAQPVNPTPKPNTKKCKKGFKLKKPKNKCVKVKKKRKK